MWQYLCCSIGQFVRLLVLVLDDGLRADDGLVHQLGTLAVAKAVPNL